MLGHTLMRFFKRQADVSEDDTSWKEEMEGTVELMNDMDTIENFNMKAGELQRLKLARR